MPDDLQQIMERVLPCKCSPNLTNRWCPRRQHGPAVLEALREAENRGAREMQSRAAQYAYRDSGNNLALWSGIMNLELPHPEQETPDE